MNVIEFSLKHPGLVPDETIKDVTNELLRDYDQNAFKLRPENQEQFIRIARKVYVDDIRRLEKTADISIRFIKTEATSLRFLCNGLEVFEALDIVKHETRRLLLGKLKTLISKDEFKLKELLYLLSLYPTKIRTRAFQQLVEL